MTDSTPDQTGAHRPSSVPPRAVPPNPGPLSRRAFLSGTAAGVVGGGAVVYGTAHLAETPPATPKKTFAQSPIGAASDDLALPGKYPGRVVEVNHPGVLTAEKKLLYQDGGKDYFYTLRDRDAVKAMVARGMTELVGSSDAAEAWRHFFSPGDRVGIKVVPVGKPDSISSHELVLEVISGLQSAGVALGNIIVFERYLDDFKKTKYPDILPDGVHWECASAVYDEGQLDLEGEADKASPEDRAHVSGYDLDIYRELAFCQPAPTHEPTDDRRFRSHLCKIVSQKVDKFICIPVLKDHRSSGVTLALKNLSHGLVNNVCRSHIGYQQRDAQGRGGTLNQCGTFIPAIVSLPMIRQKAVLQILDGLVGTYEGGPGNWNKTFATWPYRSLFFATDPVALDHVGWEIIDKKREEEGWPGVGYMGLNAKTGVKSVDNKPVHESFHIRQPEHIPLAATLGLGVFEKDQIKHQRIDLA